LQTDSHSRKSFPLTVSFQSPKNSPEEPEDAAGIAFAGSESAQQQTQIVAIGWVHGARRTLRRGHRLFDYTGEQVKMTGKRVATFFRWSRSLYRCGDRRADRCSEGP
jgi:hypothetical protein